MGIDSDKVDASEVLEKSTPDSKSPLFIVGCGRSGTTMLRLMLDAHPQLAIPSESHFIVNKYRTLHRYLDGSRFDALRLLKEVMASPHFKRWEMSNDLILERVRHANLEGYADTIELIFRVYAESRGKPRWGDKTPIYVRSVSLLADLFPTARFIHLIRDGRDVALSYLGVPWGPESIWEAARKWRIDVTAGMTSGKSLGVERYLEVRYDALVADPISELQRICAFAQLPYATEMLTFHDNAESRIGQTEHDEFHRSETQRPTSGLRDWRTQMGEKDIVAFEAMAGELLSDLGYERRFATIPIGFKALARIHELRQRTQIAASRLKRSLRPNQTATWRHNSE